MKGIQKSKRGGNLELVNKPITPTAHSRQNFEILAIDDQQTIQKISELDSPISLTFVEENHQQLSYSADELKKKKIGILGTMFPPSWRNPDSKM